MSALLPIAAAEPVETNPSPRALAPELSWLLPLSAIAAPMLNTIEICTMSALASSWRSVTTRCPMAVESLLPTAEADPVPRSVAGVPLPGGADGVSVVERLSPVFATPTWIDSIWMSWTTAWSGGVVGSGAASIGCVVVTAVPPSTGGTTSSALAGAPVTTVIINVVQIAANPCRTLTVPPSFSLWFDP